MLELYHKITTRKNQGLLNIEKIVTFLVVKKDKNHIVDCMSPSYKYNSLTRYKNREVYFRKELMTIISQKAKCLSSDLIIHPGLILKETLQGWKMSIFELSEKTGFSQSYIQKVLDGKKNISLNFAKALDKVFDTGFEVWVNLQNNYNAELKEYRKENNKQNQGEINMQKIVTFLVAKQDKDYIVWNNAIGYLTINRATLRSIKIENISKDFKPISNLMVVNKERNYQSGCRYIIARKFEEDGIWKVLVLDYIRNTSYICTIAELKKLGKTNILNADFIKGDRIRTKAHYMHIKTGKLNITSTLIQDFELILENIKEENKAKRKAEREKKKLELEKKARKQQAHEEMLLKINNIVQTAEYQSLKSSMIKEIYLITFNKQVQDKIENIKVNIDTIKNNYMEANIDLSTYLQKLNRKKKQYINKAKFIIIKTLKEKLPSSVWNALLDQDNEMKKFIENLPKNEYRHIYVNKLVKPIKGYLMQAANNYYNSEKIEPYLKERNLSYTKLLTELEHYTQKVNVDRLNTEDKTNE